MSKFFKNPARKGQQAAYTPYVPQYRLEGIEPKRVGENAFGIQGQALMVNTKPSVKFTPKTSKPVNVPYAVSAPPLPKTFKLPNIGNNIETSLSASDEEMIDDTDIVELDPMAPMIDNNDYYAGDFVGGSISLPEETVVEASSTGDSVDLEEGQYLLAIEGSVISTGALDDIQNEVRDLIFGDHKLYPGQTISAEDMVVLKRIQIKVGVFLDE